MRILLLGLVAIVVLLAGGMAVLATMPMAPPLEKVEQLVPDHELPR